VVYKLIINNKGMTHELQNLLNMKVGRYFYNSNLDENNSTQNTAYQEKKLGFYRRWL